MPSSVRRPRAKGADVSPVRIPSFRENASLRWARKCVGVDIAGEKPIAILAERTRRGRITWSPMHDRGTPTGGATAGGILVVAALRCRESLVRRLEAPFSSCRKARKVLPTLLDIQLPFPVEDCLCNFIGLHRTKERKVRALAVAARRIDVRRRLDALHTLGIDPVVLDQEGLALWTVRLARHHPTNRRYPKVCSDCESAYEAIAGNLRAKVGQHIERRDVVEALSVLGSINEVQV